MGWFYGVLAVMGIAVAGLSWQLKVAWQDAAATRGEMLNAIQVAGEQRQQAELLLQRFDQLDATLDRLEDKTEENDRKLTGALDQIDHITKTEGDSDESIACLGMPVPAQLDSILR